MNDLARTSLMFVVGLAGGLTGAVFLGGGAGPSSEPDSTSADSPDRTIKALEERVMTLEGSIESQRLAYDELDGRMLALSRRPDMEQLLASADAAQATAGLNGAVMPAGPAMTAEVRAALEMIEGEQRAEREAEQAMRRDERLNATVERLTSELGLDAGQAQVVKAALAESTVAREAMFAEMRNGGGANMDREQIGQKMTELRDAEIATVSKVLTPTQVEQYSSITSFGGGRGFGGGTGGGTGGGATGGRGNRGNDF